MKRLTIVYCPHGGSSGGIREFITQKLPEFKTKHGYVDVRLRKRAMRHPFLTGSYINGVNKQIGIKNLSLGDVSDRIEFLRAQIGRRHVKLHEQRRHVVSTQGLWTTSRVTPEESKTQQ